MKGLAELVVSLCDLCEAEGRLLQAGILRTVRRVGLLSLGLLFGGAALALLLGALYALLASLFSAPAALALLGLASAVIAALMLWGARGKAAPAAASGADKGKTPGETGAAKAGPAPAPAARSPAKAHGESRDIWRDIWADVPPYGRSTRKGALAGRGEAPASTGRRA